MLDKGTETCMLVHTVSCSQMHDVLAVHQPSSYNKTECGGNGNLTWCMCVGVCVCVCVRACTCSSLHCMSKMVTLLN